MRMAWLHLDITRQALTWNIQGKRKSGDKNHLAT